jgi:2-oxoglutarate ferredoxin oxidoreductase subunit beta
LGQLCHAIRRNVRMVYVIENNGVYGLTKGQFSASSDVGSKSKRGEANRMSPIDPVRLALTLGASFVARSFSGDKEQLVPILKAAFSHRGFALIDVVSPCVTFNDHEGSTKSYKAHAQAYAEGDRIRLRAARERNPGEHFDQGSTSVAMHDGSVVRFTAVPKDTIHRSKQGRGLPG